MRKEGSPWIFLEVGSHAFGGSEIEIPSSVCGHTLEVKSVIFSGNVSAAERQCVEGRQGGWTGEGFWREGGARESRALAPEEHRIQAR